MKKKYFQLTIAVLFLFSSVVLGQNDSLKKDLDKSFKKFDLVRINTQQALADSESVKSLRVQTAEKSFELSLSPNDLRSRRYRAETTGVDGRRPLSKRKFSTFEGFVKGEANSKVRINLSGEILEGYFVSEGTRFYIEAAKNYSTKADSTDFVVYTAENYLGDGDFDCQTDLLERIKGGKELVASRSSANLEGSGVIELATDADFQFVTELSETGDTPEQMSERANTEIMNILNMVEGVFDEELDLTIQVVFQHSWTTADSFSGATPQALATSFMNYWNENFPQAEYPRDLAHLFSSKTEVASQGYAYIGAICRNVPFAYGISGRITWEPGKFLLTAHELGHNLDGHHVEAAEGCENTIMNAGLTGTTPLTFCSFSQNEIGNFVSQEGDCLAPPAEPSTTRFDFDGDSKTDASIYRPSVGQWWYLRSSDLDSRASQFGNDTDKMVPADYTGDGITDLAFWRESTGELFVLRSEDASFYSFPFGAAGDIPVPGDFDGDGLDDFAVFRPDTTIWYVLQSSGGTTIQNFGAVGDIPLVNDYDGDGKDDLAIYRPDVNQWWINRSNDGIIALEFGEAGDKPSPADFTGDGKTDVAFWRPTTGEWYVVRSEDTSFYAAPFGATADIPVPGDYDGDGTDDLAVWRPSDRTWYLLGSENGFSAVGFGADGDIPVPASFLP